MIKNLERYNDNYILRKCEILCVEVDTKARIIGTYPVIFFHGSIGHVWMLKILQLVGATRRVAPTSWT